MCCFRISVKLRSHLLRWCLWCTVLYQKYACQQLPLFVCKVLKVSGIRTQGSMGADTSGFQDRGLYPIWAVSPLKVASQTAQFGKYEKAAGLLSNCQVLYPNSQIPSWCSCYNFKMSSVITDSNSLEFIILLLIDWERRFHSRLEWSDWWAKFLSGPLSILWKSVLTIQSLEYLIRRRSSTLARLHIHCRGIFPWDTCEWHGLCALFVWVCMYPNTLAICIWCRLLCQLQNVCSPTHMACMNRVHTFINTHNRAWCRRILKRHLPKSKTV